MKVAVHQPQYFPYPGFFHKLAMVDAFVIMDDVQYDKRFTNRNRILDSHGPIWLTVPVPPAFRFRNNSDVEISETIPWAADHWKKICLSYSNADFFGRYRDGLEGIFTQHWKRLFDLDFFTLKMTMGWLGIRIPVIRESTLGIQGRSTDRIVQVCRAVGADTYVSGIGGRSYLREADFERNGLRLEYQEYQPRRYPQRFAPSFVPDLSILDMLANVGPESVEYIASSEPEAPRIATGG